MVDENVNLCDLFATLCELCEIPAPENLDLRSLVPLMEGNATHWNNESVSQFGAHNLMIKRDHLKYQSYGADSPEVLFDLRADPGETCNFIDEPEYDAEAVARFRERLGKLGHGLHDNADGCDASYYNAGYAASA